MGSSHTLSYNDAKNYCQADGAYLATPRSYDENKFLTDMFPNTNLWIGINDIAQEGQFVSVDGHPLSYFRWSSSEPNDQHGVEDGVHIVGTSYFGQIGRWNDANAVNRLFEFVCFRRF